MRKKERKLERFGAMLAAGLTAREARMYVELPHRTPALQAIIHDRRERRARFERLASAKIHAGVWDRDEVEVRWLESISRLYSERGWRVQQGPIGNQPRMRKGEANPWAQYRSYDRVYPDPSYVSPWRIKITRSGSETLRRDLVKIQAAEKRGVSRGQLEAWLVEKDKAIKQARGQRREQLVIERNRLAKLLGEG